jgi:hypothetical protein
MPDLDDFEPPARQWKRILDHYVKDQKSTSDQLADDILAMAVKMLKHCGGCILLPQLTDLLWQYKVQLSQQTALDHRTQLPLSHLEQELDKAVQPAIHQRIEMISIRAARTTALALQAGVLNVESHQILQEKLAGQVIVDLIRHCCLDTARARSIGRRFANGDEAYHFYREVMTTLRAGVIYIARQLGSRPNGETLALPLVGSFK